MKRIVCCVLALILVMALFTSPVLAESQPESEQTPDVTGTAEAEAEAVPDPVPVEPEAEPAAEPEAEPAAEPEAEASGDGIAPISLPVVDEPETTPAYETVIVHSAGGSFPAPRQNYSELTVTLQAGRKLPTPDDHWYEPGRSGYRFTGWSKDPSGTDPQLQAGSVVPKDVTDLYACWVRTVVLDAAPGSFQGSATQNYTRTVDLVSGDKLPSDLETPVFDYTKDAENQTVLFDGWYTGKCSVTKTEDASKGYWVWSVQNSGNKIESGAAVPAGVTTLYAGYTVSAPEQSRKTITYYYDWNGIDGMYGHCLTSSRSYSEQDNGYKLTSGDLLIRYLNWNGETEAIGDLAKYWAENEFNGYTFKGWATTQNAATPDVTAGHVIKNGESLYAVWEKDGVTNQTFVRPTPGPLEAIRFNGLSIYAHGTKNATATAALYISPVNAATDDINVTWTISYGEPNSKNPLAPPNMKVVTVTNDETVTGTGFTATASGIVLTLTDTDGLDHSFIVSATATSHGASFTTPASATVTFGHNWVEKPEQHKEPTCMQSGSDVLECADCHATKTTLIAPLEHLWEFQITKMPTCTESGLKEKVCMREGCEDTYEQYLDEMAAKYGPSSVPSYEPVSLPATGHTYAVIDTQRVGGVRVFTEQCASCHEQETVKNGDANGDDAVDVLDAARLYQAVSQQIDAPTKPLTDDVNGDDTVDVLDAARLYQFVSQQVPSL